MPATPGSSSRRPSTCARCSNARPTATSRWSSAPRESRRRAASCSTSVARQACPSAPVAVLSGPTFAHEVAKGLPTAVTLAAEDSALAEQLRDRIAQPTFRIYVSDDVAGAEIGGAVKNVLAIACGVVEGKGLGQNARAALIGRGFAEMTRFGLAFGAQRETLAGLSGLGDLVLTCSSTSSRNYSLGLGIGEGRSAAELLSNRKTVAEGAFTAPVLARLAREKGIDMPIVDAVDALIAGRANVDEVLERLADPPAARRGRSRNRPRCPSSPSRRSASGRAAPPLPRAAAPARPARARAPAATG